MKKMRFLTSLAVVLLLLSMNTFSSFAMESQKGSEAYEIDSMNLLKERMSEIKSGSEMSEFQRSEIIDETDQKIL